MKISRNILSYFLPFCLLLYIGCSNRKMMQEPYPYNYEYKAKASRDYDRGEEVKGYFDAEYSTPTLMKSVEKKDKTTLNDEIEDLRTKLQELEPSQSKEESAYLDKYNAEYPDLPPETPKESETAKPKPSEKRMVYHEAEIQTRSTEPEKLFDSAIHLTKAYKGYLESRHESTIVLRIPIEHFRTVFDSLLDFGEIVDYSQSSTDITDAFFDTEARIAILEKTIKRLREIITHTKKQEDQINLLNQIKRLSEELEEMLTQREVLLKKAQYSRIAFTVLRYTPSVYHPQGARIEAFNWISELNPFHQNRLSGSGYFKLDVPEGMVTIEKPGLWLAQSAGGTKLLTAKIKNRPNGTSEFWMKAIKHHINFIFYKDTTYQCNNFQVIRFLPFPGDRFVYTVAVRVVENDIYIVEIYYPDENQYERFGSKTTSVLERKIK